MPDFPEWLFYYLMSCFVEQGWCQTLQCGCGGQRTTCRRQLFPSFMWESNPGLQAWHQVPLPTEPLHLPTHTPSLMYLSWLWTAMLLRMTLKFWYFCLHLANAGIIDVIQQMAYGVLRMEPPPLCILYKHCYQLSFVPDTPLHTHTSSLHKS